MVGATAWAAVLVGMLLVYRDRTGWVVWASLIYPLFTQLYRSSSTRNGTRERAANPCDDQQWLRC
jgi:hypothetical protein